MLLYADYTDKGFSMIPENDFNRFITRALRLASRFTFGRVEYSDTVADSITDTQQLGLFEIADLLYNDMYQVKPRIQSFSNNGYSENFGTPAQAQIMVTDEIYEVMLTYFDKEFLYRGV